MPPMIAALIVAGGVAALLVLVLKLRIPAFLTLLLVAIGVGLALGAEPSEVLASVQNGMGGTLGFVAVVVGLGAIFGALLESSGGVKAIASALLKGFGEARAGWALGLVGFIVAIPVFFDVALIILAPILWGLVRRTGRHVLYFGIPLLAGLGVTHCFVPPTPGPVAVADLLNVDLGWMILLGLAVGLPSMIVAGPVFAGLMYGKAKASPEDIAIEEAAETAIPDIRPITFLPAFLITALPLALVLASTGAKELAPEGALREALTFAGHPFVALIIACLAAYGWLSMRQGASMPAIAKALGPALEPAGVIVLVTGAGGAFKQVLVDTGAGAAIANTVAGAGWPPVVFAFIASTIVRVAQGSATVAMITAAGLAAPVIEAAQLSAPQTALAALSIAAGAIMMSHVNDSGFWLVSRYLRLSEAETLKSWTVCSTIIGGVGFLSILALSFVV